MVWLSIHLDEDKTKSKLFPSKRKINSVGTYFLKVNNRNTRKVPKLKNITNIYLQRLQKYTNQTTFKGHILRLHIR